MGNLFKYFLKLVGSAFMVTALVVFFFARDITFGSPVEDSSGSSTPAASVAVESVADGSYTGSAEGYNGELSLEVTVEDGAIAQIDILDHGETAGISDPAFETVPDAIIEANGIEGVDVASGATFTSQAIMDAVADALGEEDAANEGEEAPAEEPADQAAGSGEVLTGVGEGRNGPITVEVTVDGETITDVVVVDHEETEDISDPALETIPAAIVENNGTEGVDVASGASKTSRGIFAAVNDALGIEAPAEESEAAEGEDVTSAASEESSGGQVLQGKGEGYGGEITVDVSLDGEEITQVQVTGHSETEGISDPALEEIPQAIVENNGTDGVEAVSGATMTSQGIIAAVEEALASGQETPAEEPADQAAGSGEVLTGVGEGRNGPITVEITVEGETITDVVVVDHEETEGISDPALETIPAAIVENNGTEGVDVASGASKTSRGIFAAVNDALGIEVPADEPEESQAEEEDSADSGEVLTGVGEGRNGPITVEVTVDGETITDVVVVDHEETEGISDPALETIPAAIVENNGTEGVDVASGASKTSRGIFAAVNDALGIEAPAEESEAAEGEDATSAASEEAPDAQVLQGEAEGYGGLLKVEVTYSGDDLLLVEVVDHNETEGISDPALEKLPQAIVENNDTAGVDVVSGATATSQAIIDAVNDALSKMITENHVYTGVGEGRNGPITVEVTLDGDRIADVQVIDHRENKAIGGYAIEEITTAMVKENQWDVEVVSGATMTSEGIIEAVRQAVSHVIQ